MDPKNLLDIIIQRDTEITGFLVLLGVFLVLYIKSIQNLTVLHRGTTFAWCFCICRMNIMRNMCVLKEIFAVHFGPQTYWVKVQVALAFYTPGLRKASMFVTTFSLRPLYLLSLMPSPIQKASSHPAFVFFHPCSHYAVCAITALHAESTGD